MFAVYILYTDRFNKIYIGQTADLISRFHSHNSIATKGWSIRYRPWKVIYVAIFESRHEALIAEKKLKSGKGRAWIRKSIEAEYLKYGFISA